MLNLRQRCGSFNKIVRIYSNVKKQYIVTSFFFSDVANDLYKLLFFQKLDGVGLIFKKLINFFSRGDTKLSVNIINMCFYSA